MGSTRSRQCPTRSLACYISLPPCKLQALVELTTKMHEIAVAVDSPAAAVVDAAAAPDRLVSVNGEVHRSSASKDR